MREQEAGLTRSGELTGELLSRPQISGKKERWKSSFVGTGHVYQASMTQLLGFLRAF
jgi:hypothetical protein